MTFIKTIALVILISLSAAVDSEAGWLIYHEPEFKGTILDYDTKQPVEGAVVVVEYMTASWWMSPDSSSSIMDVRETLTDKDGNFRIPSYTKLIQPFSWQIMTDFIIFKPGYGTAQLDGRHFSGYELKEEQERSWYWTKELHYKLRGKGIVEIPKMRTREERIRAMEDISIPGPDFPSRKMQILIRLYNEENVSLGFRPISLP